MRMQRSGAQHDPCRHGSRHSACKLRPSRSMASGRRPGASDSDDLSIAGGSTLADRGPARKRRGKVVPKLRPYTLLAPGSAPPFRSGDGSQAKGRQVVVGVALAKITVSPVDASIASGAQTTLRDLAAHHLGNRRTLRGYLENESEQLVLLTAPFALGDSLTTDAEIIHNIGHCDGKLRDWLGRTSGPLAGSAGALMLNWSATQLLPVARAVLHDQVVAAVLAGERRHFHCVATSGKIARKRLLVQDGPPRTHLKTMLEDLPDALVMPIVRFWWDGPQGVRDPEVLLHWLDASHNLKEQRQATTTALKFAALFSFKSGIPVKDITKNLEFTSGRLLIKSRVRSDCTAMLLHRRWWLALCSTEQAVSAHLFVDSSPQWRGVELAACTIDIVVLDRLKRCLAPVVSLSKSQLDLNGNVAAVLWQAYLVAVRAWGSL